MTKGKKQYGDAEGRQGPAATSDASTYHTQINRTRSKLPTKRKKQRQDANFTAIPPPPSIEEYELVISMPRNRPSQYNPNGAGGRRGGRGGLGHASRGHRNKGVSFKNRTNEQGFTMKDEALNTNDNYYSRSWMEDKRSTLRHQGITFVQSGELTNKIPTPSTTENEEESSKSNVQQVEETIGIGMEASIINEPSSHDSTARIAENINNEMFINADSVELPHSHTFQSISGSRGSGSEFNVSESASIRNVKPSLSSPTIPLPPVQFISTEENIVFTPRNQRRKANRPTQSLTNWDVPADFRSMTDSTAPDWTKPRKKVNRHGGHKQYGHPLDDGTGEIEYVSPVYGLPMTITAEDALRDYLENIRAQGEISDGDDEYIDHALAEDDVGADALEELSLCDDRRRSRSVETRSVLNRHRLTGPRSTARVALSEFATPLRVDSPESLGPFNSAVDSEMDVAERIINCVHPVANSGSPDEDDAWILNPTSKAESDSSDNDSDAFEAQPDLLNDLADPAWNSDSDEFAKQKLDSDSDDDDEDLDEDDDIIANMILDDYDLDDLEFSAVSTRPGRKSLARQPNVPALPSDKQDIAAHLQSLWKRDRETKKQKKQDREKARLQGLLGQKSKSKGKKAKRAARREEMERTDELDDESLPVDMRKINEEMYAFWLDNDLTEYPRTVMCLIGSFALPPMHRFARKIVHTLAQAYNFGSKSQGSGKKRYTTLFKTSKTSTTIDERKINAILKRTTRIGPNERSEAKRDITTPGRGVKKHKDGDIVGGDAEEIASDNRGRVMLEKLGWRSGMGLGVEGGGMKLPVFAVVKAGKSGLQ